MIRFALAAGLVLSTVPALADDPFPIPTPEEREAFMKGHQAYVPRVGPRTKAEAEAYAAQDDFDALHYFLDLDFNPTTRVVSGSVTIQLESTVASLTHVVLDFFDNMTISSVKRGNTNLAYTRGGNLLDVTLDAPLALGQQASIVVSYSGQPQSTGFGSFGWNRSQFGSGSMVWSLSEPDGARTWWPCKDRPDDKATVEEWWTVPKTWIATGNGKPNGTSSIGGQRTQYRWLPTHPLTTYLVSVAGTDYATFSHTYTALDGVTTMPVTYYVYPEDLADAQVSFSNTVAMIGFYAATFGEYPFLEDKYGMSAFPFSGGMEHTTNTSYGYTLINGSHTYDYIVAHELAHQWWGDSVSPETWPDVWLNEGFASYCEALWSEHLGGASSYRSYMQSFYRQNFSGTVYDPADLFGTTVYDKGAWVLHMLRHVVGDTAFFQGMRDWYAVHKDGNGNTAQFQATMEARHGASLAAFFQEWVYLPNSPAYEYGWTTADAGGGLYRTYVRVHQTQSNAGLFTMPIDVRLTTGAGTETRVVANDAWDQTFVLETSSPVSSVAFDPDNWILKYSTTSISLPDGDLDGVPDGADNCPALANGPQADFDADGLGDACDPDDDDDLLADGIDCAPFDATQGTPDEVATLAIDGDTLSWTAASRSDEYEVIRGDVAALASGYGTCVAPGVGPTEYLDATLPAPDEGFAYLVRGVDTGCGGDGPLGSDSFGTPRSAVCP